MKKIRKNIAIRVDANAKIGMGHMQRCITLAHELGKKGFIIDFITHTSSKKFVGKEQKKFNFIWVNQKTSFPNHKIYGLVILDGYDFNLAYEKKIRRLTNAKIFVFDDMATQKHDCDMLLCQNGHFTKKNYSGKIRKATKLLIGPRYAIVPNHILKLKRKTKNLRNILINFGGVDYHQMCTTALRSVLQTGFNGRIDIGLGQSWGKRISFSQSNVHMHGFIDFTKLYQKADLIVGAAGGSVWERCSLGIPMIITSLSKDQKIMARYLQKKKAAKYIGHWDQGFEKKLTTTIQQMINDPQKLRKLSTQASRLCDGYGCKRIVTAISKMY